MNFIDLSGKKFGRLLVLRRTANKGKRTMWLCRCDCGTEKSLSANDFKAGKVSSCGCIKRELLTTHGHFLGRDRKASKEYRTWRGIKVRCFDPSHRGYHNYGGRGITMCPEWRHDFAAFLRDVGPAPDPRLTIDRIDVNGDYEPGNVQWVSRRVQSNNRRDNHRITVGGQSYTLSEAARAFDVKRRRLEYLVKLGKQTPDEIISSLVG